MNRECNHKPERLFYRLKQKWRREERRRVNRSREIKRCLVRECRDIFRDFNLKKVVLYGSVLEEKMREDSDIDILVDYLPPDGFFAFQCRLEEKLNLPVDVHTMDEDEKFTRKILQRGEVIYEV